MSFTTRIQAAVLKLAGGGLPELVQSATLKFVTHGSYNPATGVRAQTTTSVVVSARIRPLIDKETLLMQSLGIASELIAIITQTQLDSSAPLTARGGIVTGDTMDMPHPVSGTAENYRVVRVSKHPVAEFTMVFLAR